MIPAPWAWFSKPLPRGQRQNITQGEVEFIDAKGNLVFIPKNKIAAIIGVENLVIIDTKDALLVCKRGRSKDVKKMFNHLKETGRQKYT